MTATRRRFLMSGLAAGAGLALAPPVLAQGANANWVLPQNYEPMIVRLQGSYAPGQIHVDPNVFSLYFTLPGGQAIRYMVGIAKGDLYESGIFRVGAKKEWPSWKPTAEMVARHPEAYARWAETPMPGGKDNPLGARALYLFTPTAGDTMLRIHGTPQPWTVGSAVSNGCVRLANEHVMQLYDQVAIGAQVVLYPKIAPNPAA